MKKTTILLTALFCAAAFAQDLPQIAVYVTGDATRGGAAIPSAIANGLANGFNSAGTVNAVNRTGEIDALLRKSGELAGGGLSAEQIKTIGTALGVHYLCIATISSESKNFFGLDVQLRGTASGKMAASFYTQGLYQQRITSMTWHIAREIAKTTADMETPPIPVLEDVKPMAASPLAKQPKQVSKKRGKRPSVGVGMLYAGDYGGGMTFVDLQQTPQLQRVSMPYDAGGTYLYFDAVYLELSVGIHSNYSYYYEDEYGDNYYYGQQWETNFPTSTALPYMELEYAYYGAYLKFPITSWLSSRAGIEYWQARDGGLSYNKWDRPQNFDNIRDFDELWFKFGYTIDIYMFLGIYLRWEATYGFRGYNKFEWQNIRDHGGESDQIGGHGLGMKAAIGYKF